MASEQVAFQMHVGCQEAGFLSAQAEVIHVATHQR